MTMTTFAAGTALQMPGWKPVSVDRTIGTCDLLPGFLVKLLDDPYTAMYYGGVLLVSTDTTRRFIARFGVDCVKPADWDWMRVHDAFDLLPTEDRGMYQTKGSLTGSLQRGIALQAREDVEPRMFKANPGSGKSWVAYGIVTGAYAGILWQNAFGQEANDQKIRAWYGDKLIGNFPSVIGSAATAGPSTPNWEPTAYNGSVKTGGSGTTPCKYGIPPAGGVIWAVLRCPMKSRFAGSIDACLQAYKVPSEVLGQVKTAYQNIVNQLPTHAPLLYPIWYGGTGTAGGSGFGLLEVPSGDKIRPYLLFQRLTATGAPADSAAVPEERSILHGAPMVFDRQGTAMFVNGMGDTGWNDGYACRLTVLTPKPLEDALPSAFKDGDVQIPAAQVFSRISMLLTKATGPAVEIRDLIGQRLYSDVLEAGGHVAGVAGGVAGLDTSNISGQLNATVELKRWQKVTEVKDDRYNLLDGFSRHARWAISQIDSVVKEIANR